MTAETDQAIVNACANVPKTVDEIADIVGRSWPLILGDVNRLTREKRLTRTNRLGRASLWRSIGKPAGGPS